jgi:hypothetical protein
LVECTVTCDGVIHHVHFSIMMDHGAPLGQTRKPENSLLAKTNDNLQPAYRNAS